MEIDYTKVARKNFKKLSESERNKVSKKIILLSINPYLGKKLEGSYQRLRSLRAWPYRIIYEIRDSRVLIHIIKHRQGVYK